MRIMGYQLTCVWITDDKRSGALSYRFNERTHLRRSQSTVQTNTDRQREHITQTYLCDQKTLSEESETDHSGWAWDRLMTNASPVWPERVRPLLSTIVPEICTHTHTHTFIRQWTHSWAETDVKIQRALDTYKHGSRFVTLLKQSVDGKQRRLTQTNTERCSDGNHTEDSMYRNPNITFGLHFTHSFYLIKYFKGWRSRNMYIHKICQNVHGIIMFFHLYDFSRSRNHILKIRLPQK